MIAPKYYIFNNTLIAIVLVINGINKTTTYIDIYLSNSTGVVDYF